MSRNGKHAQEDVHGAVWSFGSAPHSEQNEEVAQLSQDVNDEEDSKKKNLQPRGVR